VFRLEERGKCRNNETRGKSSEFPRVLLFWHIPRSFVVPTSPNRKRARPQTPATHAIGGRPAVCVSAVRAIFHRIERPGGVGLHGRRRGMPCDWPRVSSRGRGRRGHTRDWLRGRQNRLGKPMDIGQNLAAGFPFGRKKTPSFNLMPVERRQFVGIRNPMSVLFFQLAAGAMRSAHGRWL
jgi:hypothetical protein